MNPVIFSDGIFSAQSVGGISRYFAEIFREFDELGFRAEAYAFDHSNVLLNDAAGRLTSSVNLHQTYHVGRSRQSILHRLRGDIRFLRALGKWPGCVVHHTYYPVIWGARNNPTVVTIHDMVQELFPWGASAHFMSYLKRRAVERADAIIAVSQSTANDLVRIWDVPPSKITVIHHGTRRSSLSWLDAADKANYFVFAGKRAGYKNFDRTLRAFSRTKASKEFRLVCFGGEPVSETERKLVRDLGLEDKVDWVRGDDSDLARTYLSATGLLYTSEYEGFGLPVLEAMAAGCPVICANTSSLPEVSGDAAISVDPTNEDEISDAIDKLAFDVKLRRTLMHKGEDRCAKFLWRETAKQHIDLYNKLA